MIVELDSTLIIRTFSAKGALMAARFATMIPRAKDVRLAISN